MSGDGSVVSVVMAVHNERRYVRQAVESVLDQRGVTVDLVVVDDGSTDGTADVVRNVARGVRVVSLPKSGMGRARNHGVTQARGDLLAFIDGDDLVPPGRFESQLGTLLEDREIGAVFGRLSEFVSPDAENVAGLRAPRRAVRSRLPATMLVWREVFDRVGPFDEGLVVGLGVDWSGRFIRSGIPWRMLDDVVLERRLHPASTGMREWHRRMELAHIVKASLDRMRDAR